MDSNVKSGKEILDDFFNRISEIENVDDEIAKSLANLYQQGKFTDVHIKNELQKLRDKNANKD